MTQPALLGPGAEETPWGVPGLRLLALDLSLRATGWARNGHSGVFSGHFPELKGFNGIPRLQKIRDKVLGIVQIGRPDLVILEAAKNPEVAA